MLTAYGLTETTVDSTAGTVDNRAPADGQPYHPVGAVLAGTVCHVLDDHGQPTPIGVPGTVHIGGGALSQGYLHRADLTAERFRADAFTADGRRLYFTGDLAAWTGAGELQFHGRVDDQLNHHGHRIEPGEIEAALREHPAVVAAAVAQRTDRQGVPYLAAWLQPAVPDDLPAWLADRLPAHLIPNRLCPVVRLPHTLTGKLDRGALEEPVGGANPIGRSGTPPHGATEEAIAAAWRELLDLPSVSREDNFFAVGGHSMLAIRVVHSLASTIGWQLPLRAVFDHPVLHILATYVERSRPPDSSRPIGAADRHRPLPLSFAQQRLWFLHHLDPHGSEYNVPLAMRLTGPLDRVALQRALTAVVHRHEILRTTLSSMDDGAPVQVVHEPIAVPLPLTEAATIAEAEHIARQDASLPFDLATGPVVGPSSSASPRTTTSWRWSCTTPSPMSGRPGCSGRN